MKKKKGGRRRVWVGSRNSENDENKMRSVYYDTKNALGFAGKRGMLKKFPKEKVKEWLQNELAYSLHKPIRRRFTTRPYRSAGVNYLWQMDLMEMIPYSKVNKGYKYILVCIDVFSRYVRALPTKNKTGKEICGKVEQMIKSSGSQAPIHIQTDYGKEFYNTHVQEVFRRYKINHYSVDSQFKAAIVERFNRTLRERMNRYFTYTGRKVWYNVLDDIIHAYNNCEHKGIYNATPSSINEGEQNEIWVRKNEEDKKKRKKILDRPIKVNDYVRISKISVSNPFVKNFNQNWTDETFKVKKVDKKMYPIMFVLEDQKGNEIKGKFYYEELQYVGRKKPNVYRIEKILKSKGRGAYKQYFVKWHGYDNSYNSWIKASAIEKK